MGRADAVAAEHHVVERHPAGDLDRDRSVLPDARSSRGALGRHDEIGSRGGGDRHRGLGPAGGAQGCRRRRSGHVDLGDHETRSDRGDGRRDTRCPHHGHLAGSVGSDTDRHRRPLGPEADRVLTTPPDPHRATLLVGQTPRHGLDPDGNTARLLGTEGAAIGEGSRRYAPGLTPRRVGLEVRRLDPRRPEHHGPVASGRPERRDGRHGGAPPRHGAGSLAGLGQGRPHHIPAVAIAHRDRRIDRRHVVGETGPTQRHLGAHDLGTSTLDRRTAGRGLEIAPRGGHPIDRAGTVGHQLGGIEDRDPSGATTQVRGETTLHGAAFAQPTRSSQRLEPDDDPRRTEATLTGSRRAEGLGPDSAHLRRQTRDRGDLAPGDATQRRHARHPRLAVDKHRAAAALALRTAAVLGARHTETVTERFEQRARLVIDLHLLAVELKLDHGRPTIASAPCGPSPDAVS